MDETEFWDVVDAAREEGGDDPVEQADLVVDRLTALDPESVVDFARHFESRVARAFRWDLWGVAALLLDGADEQEFDGFRCWLVGRGRHVFEGVLHDPDALAALVDDFDPAADGDGEELGCAADEAYERLTGGGLPDLGVEQPAEPDGEPFDVGDRAGMRERFPRSWRRWGAPPGG